MKKIKKRIGYTLLIALSLTLWYGCETQTVNHQKDIIFGDTRIITDTVYLADNGSHVDIVIKNGNHGYVSFGWGSQYFFENVPTWDDLTISSAYHALFEDNRSVIRMIYYDNVRDNWIPVEVTKQQFQDLSSNIDNTFETNELGYSIPVQVNYDAYNISYFKAKGKYKYNYTCNTWANEMFKKSGMYARKWTVFSSGLTSLY